jgi:hypothetical protein
MIKSDSIAQIAKALSAAQGEMNGAKKDSQNPFFKAAYSDLASVVESIRVPFAKNGLSFSQSTDSESDGSISVTTFLMHASGEYLGSKISQRVLDGKPQTLGSLITYLKRYGLQAIAGVPSIDDDGNDAQQIPQKEQFREPTSHGTLTNPPAVGPSEAQIKRLMAIATSSKWENLEVKQLILDKYKLDSSKKLSRTQYNELCDYLQKNKPMGDLPQ